MNLATHRSTKDIINKYNFKLTKSLGQNFLVDNNILSKIVNSAEITDEDTIIEIGTGIGTLTKELAQRAKKVIAIEIDTNLLKILEETLSEYGNVKIINQDILKTDIKKILEENNIKGAIKVVANLPYYITTAILMKFLESGVDIDSFVVMIQKEVANRILAKPSTKEYGSLTVAIQYYANSFIVSNVPKSAFIPEPNVDSSVIKLEIKKERDVKVNNEKLFFDVVRGSFSKRRKTILNSLSTYKEFNKDIVVSALLNSNIDAKRRGETLTINEFATLTNEMDALMKIK